jgi:hypothetical protein
MVAHTCNPRYLAEIRRIKVPGQPGQKKKFRRPHLNRKKLHMVVHSFHPSYGGKSKIKGLQFRLTWVKSENLSDNQRKRAGGVVQPVEHLPHKPRPPQT